MPGVVEATLRYYKVAPYRYNQEQGERSHLSFACAYFACSLLSVVAVWSSELGLDPFFKEEFPILFVAPDNERFTEQDRIDAVHKYLPGREVERIPDAGHFVMVEEEPKELFEKVTSEWVAERLVAEKTSTDRLARKLKMSNGQAGGK